MLEELVVERQEDMDSARVIERPKLTIEEQIEHLKSKGVKFEKCSEEDAIAYLRENNNYFKLRSYRTGFDKIENGENAGRYIDLDFAMLKDMAIIDMELRYLILQLCLDIEHFEKVKLLKYITESNDDGYCVVEKYLNFLREQEEVDQEVSSYSSLMKEISRNRRNSYCSGVVNKYNDHFPVWAFLEVISFGSLIYFERFCLKYFEDEAFEKTFRDHYYLLLSIKTLRNAAAHNNCVLNQLQRNTATRSSNYEINRAISLAGINKSQRDRAMSSMAILDLVTLFYTHKEVVVSDGVRLHRSTLIREWIARCFRHKDLYINNPVIITSFEFLQKTVDIFFEV